MALLRQCHLFNLEIKLMITLPKTLAAWGTPAFEKTVKEEFQRIDTKSLPLQEGLSQTSYVCDGPISVVVLNSASIDNVIRVKVGIFFAGINAGSCCADDPTPVSEETEYCELMLEIRSESAETSATVIKE